MIWKMLDSPSIGLFHHYILSYTSKQSDHMTMGCTFLQTSCNHKIQISFSKTPKRQLPSQRRIAMASADTDPLANWIQSSIPNIGTITSTKFMGGSSWSSAYIYHTSSGTSLFVKTSRGRDQAMFKGEALGLQAMYDTKALKIPQVYGYGSLPTNNNNTNKGIFIVMEYLELGGGGSSKLDAYDFGIRMANMHLAEPIDPNAKAGKFGFPVDNTIGGTPQPNGWMDSWVDFYRERRLRHQLELTGDAALLRDGERLLEKMGKVFFDGVMTAEIRPSVLHGDLWSGNIGAVLVEDNNYNTVVVPCIFDPATYYGHMEAEWGMSWCAGFGGQFWQGYHDVIPKQPGFEDRKQLYELYHYLNHYNLFGGSYYGSAQRIIERLLKKV